MADLDNGREWTSIRRNFDQWIEMQNTREVENKEEIFGSSCTEYEKIIVQVEAKKEEVVKITRHFQEGLGNESDSTKVQLVRVQPRDGQSAMRVSQFWEIEDPLGLNLALVTDDG